MLLRWDLGKDLLLVAFRGLGFLAAFLVTERWISWLMKFFKETWRNSLLTNQVEKRKESQYHVRRTTKTSQRTADEDVFLFDSLSKPGASHPRVKEAVKQSGDSLALPLLIGGVLLLTLGLCVWMVVYGIRAKKRSVRFRIVQNRPEYWVKQTIVTCQLKIN